MKSDYLLDKFVNVHPGEPYRLFPFGKIVKGGKTREITRESAAQFKLPHFKPAIKLGSHKEETPAGGFLVGLEVREDGLYGIPEFTEKGAQALTDGSFRYHSPEVIWEGGGLEDPTSGVTIPGPLIIGDALLHTPHLGEAAALYSIEPMLEDQSMADETVNVPKSFWEKVEAFLFTKQEPPKITDAGVVKPPVDDNPDEFAAAIKERDQYKAEIEQMKAAQVRAEKLDALVKELQSEKFGAAYVELKTAQEAADILAGMTEDQRAWVMRNFSAYIAQIKESKLTGEIGSTGEGAPEQPGEKFDAKAKAYAAEKKVDLIAAYQAVAASDPELYQAWQVSARKREMKE